MTTLDDLRTAVVAKWGGAPLIDVRLVLGAEPGDPNRTAILIWDGQPQVIETEEYGSVTSYEGVNLIAAASGGEIDEAIALMAEVLADMGADLPRPDLTRAEYPLNLLTGTELFMQLGQQKFAQVTPEASGCAMCMEDLKTLRELRMTLLREEYEKEYVDGEINDDWVEIADGLLDVIVIAWGTLLAYFGPELAEKMAAEVFNSNLAKVDGSIAPIAFREDGKILKPEGWAPPNIVGVLRAAGYPV